MSAETLVLPPERIPGPYELVQGRCVAELVVRVLRIPVLWVRLRVISARLDLSDRPDLPAADADADADADASAAACGGGRGQAGVRELALPPAVGAAVAAPDRSYPADRVRPASTGPGRGSPGAGHGECTRAELVGVAPPAPGLR